MTDLKASINQLEPAPFVGENIEIRTTSGTCAADLLVICPTGIFLGAREENLAGAQRALGGLIRDAWPEGNQPTLRSAILAGDSTRLFQLIENAKDEVSKEGVIKLLDFLGIYRSNLTGTWLESEPPTDPDDSGAYEDELRRKREAAALGEIEDGTESQYGNDGYASRSKKQNIAALATIAGTLVLAGVALWIVYPRLASPPKPRQQTPASLFVPSQPGGSAGGDAGAGSEREPGVESAGSNFSHEGAQGAELEAGRKTETESRTESAELQRGKLIDSPILAGQELRREQETAGPDFTASGAGTAVESGPEPKPRIAGGIRGKPVDSLIPAAPRPKASQPKRSASRIAEAPRVEPNAQLETTRAEKPRVQTETLRLASGTAPPLRPTEPGLYETTRVAEVRDSAGARARVIDEIPAGTRLRVTGSQGDWLVARSRTKNMTVYIRRNDAMRLAETQQQADTSVPEAKWPEIQNRIGHAIAKRGVQGVRVTFIGDTAYLKGTVKTERERERAEIAAEEIPEVKRVTNWISVDRSWNPFSGLLGG